MNYVPNSSTNVSLLDSRGGRINASSSANFSTRHFNPANRHSVEPIPTDSTEEFQLRKRFVASFKKAFVIDSKLIPLCNFNFHLFDNWFNSLFVYAKEFGVRQTCVEGRRQCIYKFRYQLGRRSNAICLKGIEGSKEKQCYEIINQIWNSFHVVIQMDLGQGQEEKDESAKAGNTIMTASSTIEENIIVVPDPVTLRELCNTEQDYEFTPLTDRFQLFDSFTVSTGTKVNELQKIYQLPSALYANEDVANVLPFKSFIYSDLDIEVRIVVNAPRFGCGKLIMASFPDSFDGFGDLTCLSENMLQRPGHVIIDLAKGNQGVVRIPNQYKRTFVRNLLHDSSASGVRTAEYATLQIEVLSAYRTGADQPTSIPVQLYYRFVKANFAGMSFTSKVTVQGLVDDLVEVGTTLIPAAKPVEKILKRVGKVLNQDKPYGDNCSVVVPKPRDNFSAGVGISDNIPLTLDHSSTVTILGEHVNTSDPKDLVSLAKIPGLELRSKWKTSDKEATTLIDWPINPSAIFAKGSKVSTVPNPLKYVCNMTNMWRGTLKVRLDIVANEFHTGTIQIETMFNRVSTDLKMASSTYVKQFDLGNGQQSVEYTIPYIYDTPWRRNNIVPDHAVLPNTSQVESTNPPVDVGEYACGQYLLYPKAVFERCRAYLRVSVINPLTPISTVSSEIEILMSISAGDDFNVHSIVPQQLWRPYNSQDIFNDQPYGQFPRFKWYKNTQQLDPWIETQPGEIEYHKNQSKFEGVAEPRAVKIGKGTEMQEIQVQGDFQDPTADFRSGIAFKSFHTTDNQLVFKDIMRRNVLILNGTVPKAVLPLVPNKDTDFWNNQAGNLIRDDGSGSNKNPKSYPFAFGDLKQSYFVPVWCVNQFDSANPFKKCAVSPHAAISTLFRHWRGSQRYVFVFKKVVDSPIYITYVPMMGAVLAGLQQNMTSLRLTSMQNAEYPTSVEKAVISDHIYFAETGMATELCLTRVNQTCAVTVPFDTNLNRCVVSKRRRTKDNSKALLGREETSAISGHMVLQCDEEIDFDMFYSVGDDFELSDFIGCPQYIQRITPLLADDRVQDMAKHPALMGKGHPILITQGFRKPSVSLRAKRPNNIVKFQGEWNDIEYQMDYLELASKAVIPAIAMGTGFVIARNSNKIGNAVSALSQQTSDVLDKANDLFSKFGDKAGEVKEVVKNSLQQVTANWSSLLPEGVNTSMIVELVLDIVRMVKGSNYIEISLVILKWVTKIFEVSFQTICQAKDRLAQAIKPLIAYLSQEQNSDKYTNSGVSLFGTLLGVVGTAYGMADLVKHRKCVDMVDAFKVRMTDFRGLNYFLVAVNFVDYLFKTFQSIMRSVFGFVDPKTEVKAYLATQGEHIKNFIDDVELVTNPNNTILLKKPAFKIKVWKTAVFGVNLKKELVKMDASVACSQLINYCNQIIKFTKEKNTALTCSPTRYEPFVICLEGPSGIGKSSVNMEMICHVLNEAGYDINGINPTYTRTPGKKHWDGYNGGLSITYDDWMNLTNMEQVVEQAAELYELKSRAFFMPQMADLADKGLSANPRIITLLTNDAFPDQSINNVTCHTTAVWRRRDVLVKVKSKYSEMTSKLNWEQTENFKHLLFSFSDPINQELINDAAEWLEYEDFIAQLSKKFKEYDAKEKKHMLREMAALQKYSAEKTTIFDDPTDILNFYFTKQTTDEVQIPTEYPSEKLRMDLEKIMDKLNEDCLEQPATVQTQGLIDDAMSWVLSFFREEKGQRMECSHCGEKTIFLLEDSTQSLENHKLCAKCAVQGVVCVCCDDTRTKKVLRICNSSITKLASLRKFFPEDFAAWMELFLDYVKRLADAAIDFLGVIAMATLLNIGLILMNTPSTPKRSKIRTQIMTDDGEFETKFDEELFDKALLLSVESKVKDKCMHDVMLSDQQSDWIYHDCCWKKGLSNGKYKIAVHFAPCDQDCILKTETGKNKYREWIQAACENFFESYQYRAEQVMLPDSTLLEANAYLELVPPCYREKSLVIKGQDFFYHYTTEERYTCVQEVQSWSIVIPKWLKVAFAVVGVGLAVAGSFTLISKLIQAFTPATQIISSGSMQTRHFLKNRLRVVKASKIKTQNHEQLKDALIDKIVRNYVAIEVWSDGKLLTYMVTAGVFGNTAIMPKHYLKKLRSCVETNERLEIVLTPVQSPNIRAKYSFSESDFIEASDSADICIFKMPPFIGTFKDIRSFIAKEKDLSNLTSCGYLIQVPKKAKNVIKEHGIKIYGFKKEVEVKDGGDSKHIMDSLHYNFSENGACGSLVCRENHTRPILAMHFAGSSNISLYPEGYGVLLTQEMFEDLGETGLVDEEIALKPAEEAKMLLPDMVEVQSIGTYEKAVFMPTKTKILPSKVQPFLEKPRTRPAYMSKQEPGYKHKDSPLLLGCKKHGILTKNFPTHVIDEVCEALWSLKYQGLKPILAQPKHLTYKEAIGGLDIPGYEAIKLDTSMGFPYVFNKQTMKKDYITIVRDSEGKVESVHVNKDVLKEQVRIDNLRNNGIRPFLPYVDELKDERKSFAKVDKPGSTRVFCMSSIHSTIAVRSNFLHFAAAYTASRFDLNHAVGISRNGPEWTKLVNTLAEVSLNNIVAMDYSNFGPGYNVAVNAKGHEIIKRWTLKNVEGVNETEIDVLGLEHYNSDHIMNDLIYRQFSGGPSGDALTVVKNGLVNEMYILLAWKFLMADWCNKNDHPLYPTFYRKTKLITYGDDLIMAVDDEIKDLFNGVTIKNFLATYGIAATDALKTGEDVPYTNILEASFLKSGFIQHPKLKGEWLAPLDQVSVEEVPKWIRSCENLDEATEQNCEAGLRESFGHGKDYFESQRIKINNALAKANLKPIFLTWEELDYNFFKDIYEKEEVIQKQ